ncbi:MAG TPA: hypothetical protein IAB46_04965 [Candidatus Scybalocola faecigallinarum]|uniref:Flavoprotein domain-containing protein n=1 Tax=Candidatus Scybalocola faecigallinarum TaxID=2840941 RepID=A0A9D1F3F9_9FIRM|nr:hypothetical protein [Candidatus Scybalocola faecigallinarum]
MKKRIIVGATGASGLPLLIRCLKLILRAADVTLKEQRPLVLSARETPMSAVHLKNLYELSMIPGVRIMPPMLTFYSRPKTIDDMVYHMAAKLLEPFGIEAKEYRRWNGL